MTDAGAPPSSTDPVVGFLDWYARSMFQFAVEVTVCGLRVLENVGPRLALPPHEVGGPAAVTVPVLETVTNRPINLATNGFRAVGWGSEFALPSTAITLKPKVLAPGDVQFEIAAVTSGLPPEARGRTIVYEGRIVDAEAGADVCDVVHFVKPAE